MYPRTAKKCATVRPANAGGASLTAPCLYCTEARNGYRSIDRRDNKRLKNAI
jgi:hypothetical protein